MAPAGDGGGGSIPGAEAPTRAWGPDPGAGASRGGGGAGIGAPPQPLRGARARERNTRARPRAPRIRRDARAGDAAVSTRRAIGGSRGRGRWSVGDGKGGGLFFSFALLSRSRWFARGKVGSMIAKLALAIEPTGAGVWREAPPRLRRTVNVSRRRRRREAGARRALAAGSAPPPPTTHSHAGARGAGLPQTCRSPRLTQDPSLGLLLLDPTAILARLLLFLRRLFALAAAAATAAAPGIAAAAREK